MNREDFKIEICSNGVESCEAAEKGGADRVELCAGIPEGGTTPSYGEIYVSREVLKNTLLHVIIRPRGGDFAYSPSEIRRMEYDIDIARRLGADGVVFGCLNPDGTIAMRENEILMRHARGMNVTFHRAFDRCKNPMESMEQIIDLGFNRILTSGQQNTAEKGIPLLKELQKAAAGRIAILAGCGVNENNIAKIQQETGVCEFHFSGRRPVKGRMEYVNSDVCMGAKGVDESLIDYTSEERVRETIQQLLNK